MMPTRSLVPLVMDASAVGSFTSHLCLQHRGKRLCRICKVARSDWHAPLDQPARDGDVALRIDSHCISKIRPVKLEQEHRVGAERPAHARAWLRDRPTYALDVEVALLGPGRWRHVAGR